MKKNRYCFVVAASDGYRVALKALLSSLEYYKHTADIILISFQIKEEFLKTLKDYSFNIRLFKHKGNNQIQGTAIDRFKVAAKLGQEYEAICLLDADCFVASNVNLYFDIASKGFIIAGSNGMVINFDRAYQDKFGINLRTENYIYTKLHTTAPIFISPKDLDWFETLSNNRYIPNFDDFLYLNILGLSMGKDKNLLCMPPYMFTGIHHFGIKPVTGWFYKNDILLTGTEENVAFIHGKWFDEGWYNDLGTTMERYYKDEYLGDRQRQKGVYSKICAMKEFMKHIGTYEDIPQWLNKYRIIEN